MRSLSRFAALACVVSAGAMPLVVLSSLSASAAIVISSAATQNMSCSNGLCVPTAKDAILNVDDLATMLASGKVEVSTGSGRLASRIEDILVVTGFSWGSANSLTLDAYRSVSFKAGAVSVNGTGAVALVTNDSGNDGTLSFQPGASLSFASTANNLTINGASYTLENSIAALARAIADNPSGDFALANSYDASQDGTYHRSPISTILQGSVEGLGNTVSNLSISVGPTISSEQLTSVGLFSATGYTASVADLELASLTYRVTAVNVRIGGIIGSNNGLVANDYARGAIRGSAEMMGGLVGYNLDGNILSSHAAVTVKDVLSGGQAGGLAGDSGGAIQLSSAEGDIFGSEAGGLVGHNVGPVIESFASGRVSGQAIAGGLVGNNSGSVQNSYATGSLKASSNALKVGGLSGFDYGGADLEYYSYSTGAVAGRDLVGGFVGGNLYTYEASSCYWNTTTSKTDVGDGGGELEGLTGLTSAELKSGLPDGFDAAVWREKKGVNHGFPYLINNPPTNN